MSKRTNNLTQSDNEVNGRDCLVAFAILLAATYALVQLLIIGSEAFG